MLPILKQRAGWQRGGWQRSGCRGLAAEGWLQRAGFRGLALEGWLAEGWLQRAGCMGQTGRVEFGQLFDNRFAKLPKRLHKKMLLILKQRAGSRELAGEGRLVERRLAVGEVAEGR